MFDNDAHDGPSQGASDAPPTIPPMSNVPIIPIAPAPTGVVVVDAAPPTPSNPAPRKWLRIGLGVLAAVLVVGTAGGAYALVQYNQPASAASQFCQDLKVQNFDSAYMMLSAKLQVQYDSGQFHQLNEALDAVEGKVTACGSGQGSGAYDYTLGGDTATVGAVITREKQGKLQGALHLVSQGSWKVDGLDTSLLGINLGALQTLDAFCAAEQGQKYDALYDLLGADLRAQTQKAVYVLLAAAQDFIDGKVTACALKSVANGNSDTATTVTISVTREMRGTSSGAVTLDSVEGSWKISKIDDAVQGTNLLPLLTASQFCADIALGDFASAYALTSRTFQATKTRAQLTQTFALPAGSRWLGCQPDIATYRVTGTQAQFSGQFIYMDASQALGAVGMTLFLIEEGSTWKVDDVELTRS
jgi:hypothetical protein